MELTTTTDDNEDSPILDARLAQLIRALELNDQLVQRIEAMQANLLEASDELDFEEEETKPAISELQSPSIFRNRTKPKPVSLIPFTRPYFRDNLGMSAPLCKGEPYSPNPAFVDLLLMRSRGSGHHHQWTDREREIILTEVRSQYLAVHNRGLIERMDRLLLENGEKSPDMEQQINQLNEQLALAGTRNMEPERGTEASKAIDWMVVAKLLPPERTSDDAELQYNNLLHNSIPKGQWTPEEETRLLELTADGCTDWDRIADQLGTGRLAWQCCSYYQSTFNRTLQKSGRIQGEEAQEIVRIIDAYKCTATGRVDWRNVGALVEGRTLNQVQYFYRKRQCPTVVRKWSRLEDKLLLAGVRLFGNQWHRIAAYLPLRNNRQVRERYKGQLEFATAGQQRRKFGTWIPAEDELIVKMSQSYRKEDGGGIDFPLITRMYFPNRNVSQVYRRYQYLARFLPMLDQHKNEDDEDDDGELMERLQKVTRKRQRDRKSAMVGVRLANSLPEDKEELARLLLEGKKRLTHLLQKEQFDVVVEEEEEEMEEKTIVEDSETEDDGSEEDEELDDEVEVEEDMTTPCYQLVKEEDLLEVEAEENDYHHLEYDQLFSSIQRLNDLRKAANGVMFSILDLNANELMRTALAEIIDPAVEKNLSLRLLSEGDDPLKDYTIGSLDTMRYFLTSIGGCTLTIEGHDTGAILPPNASTTYGWALLQTMTRSLMFTLTEEPEETVDEGQQAAMRTTEEYVEARAIFLSFFTWPALLANPLLALDEEVSKELVGKTKQAEVEGEEDADVKAPELQISTALNKRTRGRPRKRTFYFDSNGIDFVRIRARQVPIFATLHQVDVLQRLHEKGYFALVHRSRHWPTEAVKELKDRVKVFIDAVWSTVDGRLEEKGRKKQKRFRDSVPKKTKTKPVDSSAGGQAVVPVRRSIRSRISKLPQD